MKVAELLARRELLTAAQAPQKSYAPWISLGRSTSDGYSIYRKFPGRWGFGFAERNEFREREVFRSEAAVCRHVWRTILNYAVTDGQRLYRFNVGTPERAQQVASASGGELELLARGDDYVVRAALAERVDLPAGILSLLSRDERAEVVWRVAANPSTPLDVLERLAVDATLRGPLALNPALPPTLIDEYTRAREVNVRWRIARNPSVPPARLIELATDPDFGVRWGVAANPSTPVDTLRALASDEEDGVRLALALNATTPADVLTALIDSDFGDVRRAVASNPHASSETLEALVGELAYWVAQNPAISAPVLAVMAGHPEVYARLLAAQNPLTPAESLRVLARDADASVSSSATAQLDAR